MNRAKRIEIFGGIASGKTTLAVLLSQGISCGLVLENFRDNPFWKRFYECPERFAYEKNVCFLAQHTGEIKAAECDCLLICDYAVFQDIAYASLKREIDHVANMKALYEHLYQKLAPPTLLVHLRCDEEVQLRRIRARGRREEDPITIAYLKSLNQAIEAMIAEYTGSVTLRRFRSDEIDFANDPQQCLKIKQDLLSSVGELRGRPVDVGVSP